MTKPAIDPSDSAPGTQPGAVLLDAPTSDRQTVPTRPTDGGHPDPRWARGALAALLVGTAAFWTFGLSRNGWGNAFYAAAVQAGTKSWKAFLFGSSDASNAITVDKPPAALWPMELSARIFGVNTWSIQMPQVLLGVASVALLYVIVKKRFGTAAGLIAGVALALTPVATLMFRYDNPDALLTFLMIASVWALLRAVDDGRTRWLVLCGVLIGFGFLTKQLQVMLIVPGLALTYLVAGPRRLRIRLVQLMAALAGMVVAAGWWVLLIEVWPKDSRPYVGGSTTNSFLDLTFGYNGLGRLTGGESNRPGGAPTGGEAALGGASPFGHVGLARMFTGESGAHISWLLPAALILLIVGLVLCGRRSRTDGDRAQYLVWGSWLLVTAGVFSFMSGLFHDYYTIALAPAVAAVVGVGVADLWRRRHAVAATAALAVVAAVTGGWAWVLLSRTSDFVPWLRWSVLAVTAVAVVGLVATAAVPGNTVLRATNVKAWAGALAIVAALAGPLAYSVQTVGAVHTGGVITAGPQVPGEGMPGGGPPDPAPGADQAMVSGAVVRTLTADSQSYTWAAAVPGSNEAGYYQLASDQPVMALGGFGSADPAPTLAQFQDYVAQDRIHYYIPSTGLGLPTSMSSGSGEPALKPPGHDGSTEAEQIGEWVKAHFTPTTVDGVTLYDLTQPLNPAG